MTTLRIDLPAIRPPMPRGAAPLASLAAAVWHLGARAVAAMNRPKPADHGLAELWALANSYEASQPSLAADLRGAARRIEAETDTLAVPAALDAPSGWHQQFNEASLDDRRARRTADALYRGATVRL